jgi:ABC-type multidrug transport system fused ATPase/permease subunit
MKFDNVPVFKRSLLSWVFSGMLKLQLLLLFAVLITVFTRVLPLEMQKRIVNQAINLKQTNLLFIYCAIYLASVLIASGLKFLINVLQTIIAQRATADMRKRLYAHILTLPLHFFRKTQPGMVVSSLVTELATAGDFIGMAVAVPITNILTLLAFAAYLFWLNPLLAAVSMCIYPFVVLVVPILQKKANLANKNRVETTRKLSSKIAESIAGIHEIQGNGAYGAENRKYAGLVNRLERTRVVWNLYRFGIKITNNFFTNLSPFLIFILGGYLAINGQLELGALVAFLSAQEKIYDPWKELIDFYQAYQDASVSYYQTMRYFDAVPEHALEPVGRAPYDLESSVEVRDLSYVAEGGIQLLDDIDITLKSGEHLALVGFSGSGKSTLALCIGQLFKYTGGHILIGGKEVAELTKKDIVNNIGFVSQAPFIFEGTIEENLLYACTARMDENGKNREHALPDLDDMIFVLQQTGIFIDVLQFGLNTFLLQDKNKELESGILSLRRKFQNDFTDTLKEYVEFYEETKYLYFSSVSGNITFGSPNQHLFHPANLTRNEYFQAFLKEADLNRPLLILGAELCNQTIQILGNLVPDNIFFEQTPIRSDELENYKTIADNLTREKPLQLSVEDQRHLLDLSLRFIPGKHRLVTLPDSLRDLILESRFRFKKKIVKDHPDAVTFHQIDRYIHSQTILNNIFFGKAKTDTPMAQERIKESIIHLLIEADLLETIVSNGMQYQVGTKGDKLSGGQRQKLAIARAFLKEPPMLILDEATSALDNKSQLRIQNLLRTRFKGKTTVIAVVHRLDTVKSYDKIAVMKSGKISEMGTYEHLMANRGMLYELVSGKTG